MILMFQFTPVMRRATATSALLDAAQLFQFTPVMRRATQRGAERVPPAVVSIHARHATGDTPPIERSKARRRFQFTPVMRRAT